MLDVLLAARSRYTRFPVRVERTHFRRFQTNRPRYRSFRSIARNLRLAVAHLLRTIGEAARRVSREFQEAQYELPWSGIVGMRHKVVHDYMDVVWKTAVEEIPRLVAALAPLVRG